MAGAEEQTWNLSQGFHVHGSLPAWNSAKTSLIPEVTDIDRPGDKTAQKLTGRLVDRVKAKEDIA
ncbi:MAG: hypothetical protein PVH84_14555 [Candidatus Aminicenantes bacterium]|jgi:hypothetical protein